MRGNTSGAAGFAGSGAGVFTCATGFATGAFGSSTIGAGAGGAGCTNAKSGGFGGATASGGAIRFAACTTPSQCSPLSAPTTSNAPSEIHTKGEVRRGAGRGKAVAVAAAAAAVAARGTPVELCVKFVVVVPSMRDGGITGAALRKFDS